MSDGIQLIIDDDGVASFYDDTWDITIHCESEAEHDEVIKAINSRHWIPCSERLPETDDPVLITLYDGTVCEAIFVYHTHDRSYWVKTESGYDYECNEVTAWMPLPEPYKEDKE